MHGFGLRHDHQPRGVAVEAVDDPGPPRLRPSRRAAGERLRERAGRVAGRRVHHHAGGLVHHHQVLVLEHDLVGHALAGARVGGIGHLGQLDPDRLAGLHGIALLPPRAVHGDRAALDQALRSRARPDRVDTPEEMIEALACGLGRHDNLERRAHRCVSTT